MLNPEFWQFYGVVLALLSGWAIVALVLAIFIGRFIEAGKGAHKPTEPR